MFREWDRSCVGVGVVTGVVPGHTVRGEGAARGSADGRAESAHHRLLRLHAGRPSPQPVQQGRGRAGQRAAHDAARVDLVLLLGTRPGASEY